MNFWDNVLKFFKSSNDIEEQPKPLVSNKSIKINTSSFTLFDEVSEETFDFDNVESIFAFKVDLVVIDSICLEFIFKDGTHIRLNEDQKGWYQLMVKIGSSFTLLDESWYFTVMQPPFETNLTLIFDKQNRSFEDILSKEST